MARDLKNALDALRMETALARGARPARRSHSMISMSRRSTRRSAMAASGGSPPAFSIPWPTSAVPADRLRHPLRVRHVPAGARATASRSSCPTTGSRDANPWEFPRSERTYLIRFGGKVEHRDYARPLGRYGGHQGRGVRPARSGLRQPHRQHAAAVEPEGHRRHRSFGLQPRRFLDASRPASAQAPWAACSIRTTARPKGASSG